jgi:hypothetical protein
MGSLTLQLLQLLKRSAAKPAWHQVWRTSMAAGLLLALAAGIQVTGHGAALAVGTCGIDLSSKVAQLEQVSYAIDARLTKIEQALLGQGLDTGTLAPLRTQMHNQGLALALLKLGMVIQTYQPFVRELGLVRSLGREEGRLQAPIDQLAPHATTGVATMAELRNSFGILLLPKLEALATETESSWMGQVWSGLWATVVPLSQPDASSPATSLQQGLVRTAMDRLSEDDLRSAVDLLSQLHGPAAALTTRWLVEAKARLHLDAAYEAISRAVLALLSPTTTP